MHSYACGIIFSIRDVMIKYVCLKSNVNIHWWGKNLFFFKERNKYVKLSKVDIYIIKYIDKLNKKGIEIDKESTKKNDIRFVKDIEKFVNEYCEYLYMSEKSINILRITGKYNYYYPLELHVSLTKKCYQKCIHCYKDADNVGAEIDYTALNNFLKTCSGYVPYLYFSGGEPLLHNHFSDLITLFYSQFDITVLSSGIGIEKYVDLLKIAGCTLVVTLFSSNEKTHDTFAGRRGSYKEIILGIRAAIEKKVPVIVTTFLCKANSEDIVTLIEDMLKMGVDGVNVGKISKIGRTTEEDYKKIFLVEPDQEKFFLNIIREYKQVNYLGLVEDIGYGRLPNSLFECSAGSTLWSIDESGMLFPCAVSSMADLAYANIEENVSFGYMTRKRYIRRIKRMFSKDNRAALSCPLKKYCKSCK